MSTIASLEEFMGHPLVVWVQTFKDGNPLDYMELVDGVLLNDAMTQIDTRPSSSLRVNGEVNGDINLRIQNLDTLMKKIKSFYLEMLDQLIVMKLPNILTIAKEPLTEEALREVQKVLLLMLGCAVQCEQKELFIERIKLLDLDVQQDIVLHIQEVTDNSENVFNLELGELSDLDQAQKEIVSKNMINHLRRLASERDDYSETIMELSQEKEYLQSQADGRVLSPSPSLTSPGTDKRHVTVELAESKAKLRRMRQELEEKNEMVLEYKEEVEKYNTTMQKLRQENLELTQDARSARAYRDELDVWKEKASKAEKYENEIAKYREKLNELEYLKKRVEELKEDNTVLLETKSLLEEQVTTANDKLERGHLAEAECLRLKAQIETLEEERDMDRGRIAELAEEVARLSLDHKQSLNESASLGVELEKAKLNSSAAASLSAECNDSASSKVLKLEKECQRLQREMETMRESAGLEAQTRLLEVEKENQRLSRKLEKVQEASSKEMSGHLEIEQENSVLKREKKALDDTILTIKENSERYQKEWDAEKEQLERTIETLRERNKKDVDQRIQDVEKENRKLLEDMMDNQSKLSKAEHETKQLQKSLERLKERTDRIEDLEKSNEALELEKEKLSRNVEMLKLMCEKFDEVEKKNTELEVETSKVTRALESAKVRIQRLEHLENENVRLKADTQTLQRSLDAMKGMATRITEMEHDKEECERENRQLQNMVEGIKTVQDKVGQLEVDNMKLGNEKRRVEKVVELNKETIHKLERENENLEAEVERLKKQIEALSLSEKRLEELEKDNKTLELEQQNLTKEKQNLEKEIKRLRGLMESRDQQLDKAHARIGSLEQDNKLLQKTVGKNKGSGDRAKELERENKELLKHSTIDKKTLATLREELVNEKIKTQQLSNDLEKLTSELDRIGLDKEKLLQRELTADESRYKDLESRMEDTLKKSMDIKDDKINTLETKLQSAVSKNQQLTDELKKIKIDNEIVKEQLVQETSSAKSPSSNTTQEAKVKRSDSDRVQAKQIMQMKDHLVELERKNATFLAENTNMQTQVQNLEKQSETLRSDCRSFQNKVESLQDQNMSLQAQNAKLQVEHSTISAQMSSLRSKLNTQETDYDKLKDRFEELSANHEALLNDHENLVQLHETLSTEYESLDSEHGTLKSHYRHLKGELQDVQQKCQETEKRYKDLETLKSSLKEEEAKFRRLKSESQSVESLQKEYNILQEKHTRMDKEYQRVEGELKSLKGSQRTHQLNHTNMQGQLSESKDQCQSLEMERAKLEHRCEMLYQLNANLEEENRKLMEQLSQLMAQNSELLVNTLETKELHHEEQRQLEDQLHNMRRQKEKLENKIMEQYKSYTSPSKKTRGGLNFKFMKRIYKSKSRDKDREREKRRTLDGDNHLDVAQDSLGEASSIGSGIDSLDGSIVMETNKKLDDRRASLDSNNSVVRRKRDSFTSSAANRQSMPSHVLDGNSDSKGAFSMSSEDLRMSRDSLDKGMMPSVSTPMLHDTQSQDSQSDRAHRRSSNLYSVEESPPSSVSPSSVSNSFNYTESEIRRGTLRTSQSSGALNTSCNQSPSTSAIPTATNGRPQHTSTPNSSSQNTSPPSKPPRSPTGGSEMLDDDGSGHYVKNPQRGEKMRQRSGAVGMLSRIKSRSREILTDLRAGSLENLNDISRDGDGNTKHPQATEVDGPVATAPHKTYGSEDSIEASVTRDLHSVNDSSKRTVKDVEFEVLDDEEEEIVTVRSPKREKQPVPSSKGALGSSAYTARPYAKQNSREDNKSQSSASYALPSQGSTKVIKPKQNYPDNVPIKAKSIPIENAAREMSKSSEQLSPRGKDMLTKENLANLEARLRLVNIAGSPDSSPSNVRRSPAKTAGNAETKAPSGKPPVPLPKSRPVSATEKTLRPKPTPATSKEDKEKDPPKKNSVWYEYGCV
ncbi:girdin-like isoform X2 [Lytechinus variegatus]|uniref:girdin-like isoform X2 n=1 Tax=Lytechinus variegatus TaxID=7654 RepID=UPI001BB1856A|nr:girdin-like isoform X2 [Lytechinus variegatus]